MKTKYEGHTPDSFSPVRRLVDSYDQPYATMYLAHLDIGVCMVWAPPGDVVQESNARLVADSPKLLAALVKIVEADDALNGYDTFVDEDAAYHARLDAIDEARKLIQGETT